MAEVNFPTEEEFAKKIAEKSLDEFLYEGKSIREWMKIIAEQEPCEDCISRAELLKAIDTWDKFGCDSDTRLVPYKDHYIPYIHYDDVIKCIKGMPSIEQKPKTDIRDNQVKDESNRDKDEQEHCEDYISRQAVLEITAETGALETQERVKALPSVTPIRPKGHWIYTLEDWNKWECSECGYTKRTDIHVSLGYNYCPKCGCRMSEVS